MRAYQEVSKCSKVTDHAHTFIRLWDSVCWLLRENLLGLHYIFYRIWSDWDQPNYHSLPSNLGQAWCMWHLTSKPWSEGDPLNLYCIIIMINILIITISWSSFPLPLEAIPFILILIITISWSSFPLPLEAIPFILILISTISWSSFPLPLEALPFILILIIIIVKISQIMAIIKW